VGKHIKLSYWALHLSAVVYFLIGAGVLFYINVHLNDILREVMFPYVGLWNCATVVFFLLLCSMSELVVWGLKRKKFWAWVTGVILFGTFLFSAFLPLGVMGLIGLLERKTRIYFMDK
jgi:hypothetical protein